MRLEAPAIVVGLAGFLLGGYAVFVATDAQRTADDFADGVVSGDEQLGAAFERITALERDVRAQNERLKAAQADERQLRDKVGELLGRVEALEDWSRALPERMTGGGHVPDVAEPVSIGAERRARFEALRDKVWAGTATADEEAQFWNLARTTGVLDETVKDLEGLVNDTPRDIARRMQLADAYTQKLLTVPDGPERGVWAGKAEAQWAKVLEIDDRHWEARFNRAFSWSQWPPFLGKGPAAIEQFEILRGQQESGRAEPHHVQVYVSLAELYRGQGNVSRANEVLRAGVDRHPDNDRLRQALDAATR